MDHCKEGNSTPVIDTSWRVSIGQKILAQSKISNQINGQGDPGGIDFNHSSEKLDERSRQDMFAQHLPPSCTLKWVQIHIETVHSNNKTVGETQNWTQRCTAEYQQSTTWSNNNSRTLRQPFSRHPSGIECSPGHHKYSSPNFCSKGYGG